MVSRPKRTALELMLGGKGTSELRSPVDRRKEEGMERRRRRRSRTE